MQPTAPIAPGDLIIAMHAALSYLPARMSSYNAHRMMMAICYQESDLAHRRQQPHGPARGYAQFELGGLLGIMRHPATAHHFAKVATELDLVDLTPEELHAALEHHDVWMMACTRLNLWWYAAPLADEQEEGLRQYLAIWRPGKAKPEKWPGSWASAERALAA